MQHKYMTEGQADLQYLLMIKTGCEVQHNGFPCNTCFHAMTGLNLSRKIHDYWEATLLYRGDYTNDEIPMGRDEMEELIGELRTALRKDTGEGI